MPEIKSSSQLIGIALKGQDGIILKLIAYSVAFIVNPKRIEIIRITAPKSTIQQFHLVGTTKFVTRVHPIYGPFPDFYVKIHSVVRKQIVYRNAIASGL